MVQLLPGASYATENHKKSIFFLGQVMHLTKVAANVLIPLCKYSRNIHSG